MKRKYRRVLESGKTILIVLLALSAVFLVGQTKIYSSASVSSESGWLGFVTNIFAPLGNSTAGTQPEQTGKESRLLPVRLAVRNEDGCYGVQYNTQAASDDFELRLGTLLGEALADAGTPFEVSETAWKETLGKTAPAVYYDFLSSIPLSTLSYWLTGEENAYLTGSARRMVLASGSGTAILYYENAESGKFYACSTPENTLGHLTDAVDGYVPNNAFFAFQNEEQYGKLDPYDMLLPTTPTPAVFEVSNPISMAGESNDTQNELLKALSFHPQTSSGYPAPDAWVVREGTDNLRIYENGTVTFHSSDSADPRYPVSGSAQPDEGEILEAAYNLAEDSIGLWCGEAQIYYQGMETLNDGTTALYFNYVLDGAVVKLYEDGYAARFVVRDDYISDFVLHFRQYKATGTTTILLPELQATAAMDALGLTKSELTLCYQDSGKSEVIAGWVAKQSG
ncbi:hypothetical protein SDC9_77551 [bioreactor metagenome]|uniref:Uncharacterized protein n=1 Tax=bioreactor metagenome TaxID=1076179 RepID=A0A644YSQ6_9ZZZZ